MWSEGRKTIGGHKVEWQVKHFDEPSHYGINNGKISKLFISVDGNVTCNYDRGWDKKPADDVTRRVYNELIHKFN